MRIFFDHIYYIFNKTKNIILIINFFTNFLQNEETEFFLEFANHGYGCNV